MDVVYSTAVGNDYYKIIPNCTNPVREFDKFIYNVLWYVGGDITQDCLVYAQRNTVGATTTIQINTTEPDIIAAIRPLFRNAKVNTVVYNKAKGHVIVQLARQNNDYVVESYNDSVFSMDHPKTDKGSVAAIINNTDFRKVTAFDGTSTGVALTALSFDLQAGGAVTFDATEVLLAILNARAKYPLPRITYHGLREVDSCVIPTSKVHLRPTYSQRSVLNMLMAEVKKPVAATKVPDMEKISISDLVGQSVSTYPDVPDILVNLDCDIDRARIEKGVLIVHLRPGGNLGNAISNLLISPIIQEAD